MWKRFKIRISSWFIVHGTAVSYELYMLMVKNGNVKTGFEDLGSDKKYG